MHRPARQLLLAALIGLPVSIAPAWYGAATWRPDVHQIETPDALILEGPYVTRSFSPDGRLVRVRDRCGWPWRSLTCEYEVAVSPRREIYCTGVRWGIARRLPPPNTGSGIALRPAAFYARALPLRPIPLGFAANYAIAFAICVILVTTRDRVVRRHRRRSGRCVTCGHDLGGGERCPECGAGFEGRDAD